MRQIEFLSLSIIFAVILFGCTPKPPQTQPGTHNPPTSAGGGEQVGEPDFFTPAEKLAKRVALYVIAGQEGDLTPYTAKPEEIQNLNVPEVTRQINSAFWRMDWSTTRLKPLLMNEITALEQPVFPLIALRLDESDKENGWCLYALGYDPTIIQLYVAAAHTDWTQDRRDFYLQGVEQGCRQVWCVRIQGEWRILAEISCIDTIVRLTPPVPTFPPPGSRSAGQTENIQPRSGESGSH